MKPILNTTLSWHKTYLKRLLLFISNKGNLLISYLKVGKFKHNRADCKNLHTFFFYKELTINLNYWHCTIV